MKAVITADSAWTCACREELLAWQRAEGIEPDDTKHIEIDTEAMTATVYQYKRNESGQFYVDPEHPDEAAMREPWTKPLSCLPPGGMVEVVAVNA